MLASAAMGGDMYNTMSSGHSEPSKDYSPKACKKRKIKKKKEKAVKQAKRKGR